MCIVKLLSIVNSFLIFLLLMHGINGEYIKLKTFIITLMRYINMFMLKYYIHEGISDERLHQHVLTTRKNLKIVWGLHVLFQYMSTL